MIKRNKLTLIVSSIVILLPMLLGLLADNVLPEEITVHWGIDGSADGFMQTSLFFLIMPPILLAVHWLCVWGSSLDSRNQGQNRKVTGLVLWITDLKGGDNHGETV